MSYITIFENIQSAKNILNKAHIKYEIHYDFKSSFEIIEESVCKFYAIPNKEILYTKCRITELVFPRQIIQYFAKMLTNMSYQQIANRTGGKHHATIINSVKRIRAYINSDKYVRNIIEAIEENIKNFNHAIEQIEINIKNHENKD